MAAAQQIIQGTWDDIVTHADEFRGRQLTVIVTEEPPLGTPLAPLDDKATSLLTYLSGRLANALTDPDEIREAEAEQAELLRRLNQNRIEAGESPLIPE